MVFFFLREAGITCSGRAIKLRLARPMLLPAESGLGKCWGNWGPINDLSV